MWTSTRNIKSNLLSTRFSPSRTDWFMFYNIKLNLACYFLSNRRKKLLVNKKRRKWSVSLNEMSIVIDQNRNKRKS